MTAPGQLYIDEDCRDTFEKELNKVFGKGSWRLDGGKFYDCWDLSNFPAKVDIDICNKDNKVIGKAIITSKPIIEDEGAFGRSIIMKPVKIQIKKLKI